jgi:hypothetical protein
VIAAELHKCLEFIDNIWFVYQFDPTPTYEQLLASIHQLLLNPTIYLVVSFRLLQPLKIRTLKHSKKRPHQSMAHAHSLS